VGMHFTVMLRDRVLHVMFRDPASDSPGNMLKNSSK
jgi:hypothetical protein